MPAWMHDRADHIMAKNPDMPKSEAFAIATQQMHSLGKTPKGYGTAAGKRTAKKKYKTPEDDVKTAADLTPEARADLPKKDFAVPAKKSNTGERAYPIPDRQHAASALGFAKMHGDSADYARVKAKVLAKYPDMLSKTSSMQVRAFRDEVEKLAAHTPEEAAKFRAAALKHNEYDRLAGEGKLSPEHAEAMRHNVERIHHFKEKKKNDSYKIPDWAHKPNGKPPAPPPRSYGRSSWPEAPAPMTRKSKIVTGLALGGLAAGLVGEHYLHKRKMKREAEEKEKANSKPMKKAAAKKKEEEKKPTSNTTKVLAGYGGAGAMAGGNAAFMHLLEAKAKEHDDALFRSVKSKGPKGVPIYEDHPGLKGKGAHFFWGNKANGAGPHISTDGSRNPSILAHEMGHADINSNRMGRMLQNEHTHGLGALAEGGASTLVGGLTGLSNNQTVQRAGVLAPAVMSLPQLAYEAGASIQGLRRMHGAGANRQQMIQGLKTLGPAFGAYATRAGFGVGKALGAQGVANAVRNEIAPENNKIVEASWKDKLPGGLSDKKTPDDFDASSLREGRKVEKEHTKDKHLQTEISMDHLTEDPAYYKKLKKMEKGAMDLTTMKAFSDELVQIKEAGLWDSVKNVALTDVGGPKGILKPIGQATANAAPAAKKPGADFAAWQAKQRMRKAAQALPPMHPRSMGTGTSASGALPSKPKPLQAKSPTPISDSVTNAPSGRAAAGMLPMHPAGGMG